MVSLRGIVRYLLAEFVYRSGLFALRMRWLSRRRSLTLMYHRVLSRTEGGSFLQPGMYVEPDTFERHLLFLKKYFNLWPAATLYSGHTVEVAKIPGKPLCTLTFDDGWCDFYTHAYPLLVKHQVPAMVFLPTGFVGTRLSFWTERLGRICTSLLERGLFERFQGFTRKLVTVPDRAKKAIDFYAALVQVLKPLRIEEIKSIMTQIETRFVIEIPDNCRDFLSWEEIADMQRSGLVTFGSHTENHLLLNTLKNEEIQEELVNSKQALLSHLSSGISDLSFCYPNGNLNVAAVDLLEHAGYGCAFTTIRGWNTSTTHRFELRRVGVHQDITTSRALLAYRILVNS